VDPYKTNRLAFVIEDEIQLAAIYARALELAGYMAIPIYNGQEAMDYLNLISSPPALIVLDLILPLLSGKEILRFIRRDARFSKTRVILATADSAAVIGEIEAKSDLVLLKPIGFTQLRELASRFHEPVI
jgi:sigma-B regulation protein RsbU (phosphoserine phosphatase)